MDLYLEDKAIDCRDSTVQNHHSSMKHFLEWGDEENLENLNELSGRDIQQHHLWINDGNELSTLTINNILSAFRVFLKWAGSVEAVPENLYSKLMIPRVRRSEQRNEEIFDAERAKELPEHLAKYRYASLEHTALAFLWETGMRVGAAHSVDLANLDFDNECVELVHRPNQETTLKNGNSGERLIALSSDLTELLANHVETNRNEVIGEQDLKPLFTTRQGRICRTSMRRLINRITAP